MMWPFSVGCWRPLIKRLPSDKELALTFDDGPTPETTPRLLKLLAKRQAQATFFVTGVRASRYGELISAIVEAGHSVYGHGWDHVNLERDPDRAVADMRRVEDELSRYRPTPATYMVRLPYNAGYARARIHRAMQEFHPNAQFAWWSHSTLDYEIVRRSRSRKDMFQQCHATARQLGMSGNLGGGIVLLHEQPFDVHSSLSGEVAPLLTRMILDVAAELALRCVAIRPAPTRRPLLRWILTPVAGTAG